MRNTAMVFAGISGCTAVILGAFGAHGLKGVLNAEDMHAYETAVYYQLFNTLALMAVIALADKFPLYNKTVRTLFMLGIIFFSGSIYLLSMSDIIGINFRWLGPVTPLGGLCLIAGWFTLFLSAIKHKQVHK